LEKITYSFHDWHNPLDRDKIQTSPR